FSCEVSLQSSALAYPFDFLNTRWSVGPPQFNEFRIIVRRFYADSDAVASEPCEECPENTIQVTAVGFVENEPSVLGNGTENPARLEDNFVPGHGLSADQFAGSPAFIWRCFKRAFKPRMPGGSPVFADSPNGLAGKRRLTGSWRADQNHC